MDVKMELLARFFLGAKISSLFVRICVDWLLLKIPIFQWNFLSRSIFVFVCTNKLFFLTKKWEIFGIFKEKIIIFLKFEIWHLVSLQFIVKLPIKNSDYSQLFNIKETKNSKETEEHLEIIAINILILVKKYP